MYRYILTIPSSPFPPPPTHTHTHNTLLPRQAYSLVMGMLWKRLNDSGKNWRHVYKVIDCCVALSRYGVARGERFWHVILTDVAIHSLMCINIVTCTCNYYPADIFSYSRAVQYHTILDGP